MNTINTPEQIAEGQVTEMRGLSDDWENPFFEATIGEKSFTALTDDQVQLMQEYAAEAIKIDRAQRNPNEDDVHPHLTARQEAKQHQDARGDEDAATIAEDLTPYDSGHRLQPQPWVEDGITAPSGTPRSSAP